MKIGYEIFGRELTLKGALKNMEKWVNKNDIEIISILQRNVILNAFHDKLIVIYKIKKCGNNTQEVKKE